jgi:DNA-binding transcriptional MerR regulator
VGPGAHYSEAHLTRLRLIKRLQRRHLPLAEIRARLASMTEDEIRELAEAEPLAAPKSAVDYVRFVLAGQGTAPPADAWAPPALSLPNYFALMEPPIEEEEAPPRAALHPGIAAGRDFDARDDADADAEADAEADLGRPDAARHDEDGGTRYLLLSRGVRPEPLERSQWERLVLSPDIELHIRRPLSRIQNRRVERLVAMARRILEEDQP